MTRTDVSPFIDDYPERYASGLLEASQESLGQLLSFLETWRYLAPDACRIGQRMSERDLRTFRAGLRRERRGIFGGRRLDPFVDLLLPNTMLTVSVAAARFGIRWGSAFHRLLRSGLLVDLGDRIALRIRENPRRPSTPGAASRYAIG